MGINRLVLRKLRARVQKVVADLPAETRATTLQCVTDVYTGRLLALIDERDGLTQRSAGE